MCDLKILNIAARHKSGRLAETVITNHTYGIILCIYTKKM